MRSLLSRVCVGLGVGVGLSLATLSCDSTASKSGASAAASAEPMGVAECASCNMVVREQPAPRAQLVHRDGTRAHFCSIGDMLPYLASPSPHGKPEQIFVEVMSLEEEPATPNTSAHPWAPAESASYVVGVTRPGVMGPPVLSYANPELAQQAAKRHAGRVQSFEQLKQGAGR